MADPIDEETGADSPPAGMQSPQVHEEGTGQNAGQAAISGAGPGAGPNSGKAAVPENRGAEYASGPSAGPGAVPNGEYASREEHRAGRDFEDSRLPALLLHAGGIHSYREYDRIFRRLSSPEFWVTTLFELVFILLIVLYKETIITALNTYLPSRGSHGIEIIRIAVNAVAMLMILHLFIRSIRYSAAAARRKQLKQIFTMS